LGVDLEMAAILACRSDHALHVDFNGLTLANQTTCRVTNNGDVAVPHGADDTISLGLAGQVEMRVHGRDHDIELGQGRIGQIEGSVFEDIDLDTLENGNAMQALIESIELFVPAASNTPSLNGPAKPCSTQKG
jgi:hypothetical protein